MGEKRLRLTEPQHFWLGVANARWREHEDNSDRHPEVTPPTAGGGLVKTNFHRLMARLVEKGLMESYHHGGYVITDAGRKVVNGETPHLVEARR